MQERCIPSKGVVDLRMGPLLFDPPVLKSEDLQMGLTLEVGVEAESDADSL
jgi:hypothetical protein